jgi:hypothetical protein
MKGITISIIVEIMGMSQILIMGLAVFFLDIILCVRTQIKTNERADQEIESEQV